MAEVHKKLLLLDGNGLAYRAFYALPPMSTSSGEKVQAVYGFTTMFLKILEEIKPDYVAASFDKAPPSERLKEYGEYKAHRQKMPETLSSQLQLIEKMLELFNIPIFWTEGYEADDCIGTMAVSAERMGVSVIIVSGDRDLLQLVSPGIKVMTPKKGISSMTVYDPEQVREKFGLSPSQIVDLKSLAGDSSDNIPGVPGIGDVSAKKLIQDFHTLEGVLENLQSIQPRWRDLIIASVDLAKLSKRLATIKVDLELPFELERCKRRAPAEGPLREFLQYLEFNSLRKKLFPSEDRAVGVPSSVDFSRVSSRDEWNRAMECFRKAESLAVFRMGKGMMPFFPENLGLSISSDSSPVYYVPFVVDLHDESRGHNEPRETLSEKYILGDLLKLFESREMWGYDIKELLHMFVNQTGSHPERFFDVAIASHLLEPQEASPKLSAIARKYLGKEIESREEILARSKDSESLAEQGEALARCAANAAGAILEVVPLLEKRLGEMELHTVYHTLELPMITVLAHMERKGIFADNSSLRESSKLLGERISSLETTIYELGGEKFNINSPKQLGEILFGKLKIPSLKKTKQGYSTSQEVLQDLADSFPIVRKVLEYKEVKKLQSTYAEALPGLISSHSGRIHSTFSQKATATGRLSSSEPNLQNIPVRSATGQIIRAAFRPQNGEDYLVEADYSQIELRVLAHLSRDERLIAAFQNDEDVHAMTAGEIFGIEPGSVDEGFRRKAKEVNFGIIYGMSAHGLAQRTGISRNEARAYIDKYMERFSGVRRFIESTIAETGERGFVITLMGRKRWLPDLQSRNMNIRKAAERMAINTPVQGSAAELIKLAMISVHRQCTSGLLPAGMILQVHDELLFEAHENMLQEVCRKVREIMEGIYPQLIVPLRVKIKTGKNWTSMKEYLDDVSHGEVVGAARDYNNQTV